MSTKEFLYICLAILLRTILSLCGLVEFLETRVEISTPFNSWIRVKEAFALQNAGFSPYAGDAVHCNPILLIMFNFIDRSASWFAPFLFCLLDIIAAFLLSNATYLYRLKKQSTENLQKSQFAPNTKHLLLNENENTKIYLFNPVVILSTVAKTTSTITNCLLSCVLFCFIQKKPVLCIFFLTMLLFVDVYFATLIIPVFLFISQGGHFDWKRVMYLNLFFLQCLGCFALLSYLCFGDWSFLNSTIGAVLTLSDLTPNFGLYWYYFVEMFDHFRLFFLFVFHLCPFIYTIPLAINLRKDAFFLIYIQLLITTLFKSYPSIADFAVAYSLVPCFAHLFHMQYRYLILFTWFTCMVLSPVMWYLWIDQGSANANFFFAVTLVYLVAQKEENIPDACQSQTFTSTWRSENATSTTDTVNTTNVVTSSDMVEQKKMDFERKRAEHYANEAIVARQYFDETFPLNNHLTMEESSKDLQSTSADDKKGKNKQNEEDLPNETAGKEDEPEGSKKYN
ncbi:Phosphatidylinositol glycan anchor biosynthesis class U protein [Trichinella nativa]|uniref:Phosphatidylinositol glycan anchor biosynthesis class U protein n=1 Tax=Trichinella nativa TaxID=6335 RepID=A0A0V1KR89_9BILA|nr:Phosphatidylinositol glycan anchor biosynthesis class U protein [Trichinella nativa]